MAIHRQQLSSFIHSIKGASEALKEEQFVPEAIPGHRMQLLWSGHVYDRSGYAHANRELLFRLANSFRIGFHMDGISQTTVSVDPYTRRRLQTFERTYVRPSAPLLRFYTPMEEKPRRYRICFTMMETETVHPEMIRLLNDHYEEVWTPTYWNKRTFESSGVTVPVNVIPLGIDPILYRPAAKKPLFPPCERLTGRLKGKAMRPEGFTFLYVFQPTFRKGVDVIVEAFEKAFASRKDVSLVLGVTTHGNKRSTLDRLAQVEMGRLKSSIYALSGTFTDLEMASIYNAAHAYVCTSRGEGLNLPLLEAAACGLPVIAPMAYSHLDILNHNTFAFQPDGISTYPGAEEVSKWYDEMRFVRFGPRAIGRLIERLQEVATNLPRIRTMAKAFCDSVHAHWTWDNAAQEAARRLLEVV